MHLNISGWNMISRTLMIDGYGKDGDMASAMVYVKDHKDVFLKVGFYIRVFSTKWHWRNFLKCIVKMLHLNIFL